MTDMLTGVVSDGTGACAAIPGYTVAGKTGTSRKAVDGGYSDAARWRRSSGSRPPQNPRLAAIVVLDEPTDAIRRCRRGAGVLRDRCSSRSRSTTCRRRRRQHAVQRGARPRRRRPAATAPCLHGATRRLARARVAPRSAATTAAARRHDRRRDARAASSTGRRHRDADR